MLDDQVDAHLQEIPAQVSCTAEVANVIASPVIAEKRVVDVWPGAGRQVAGASHVRTGLPIPPQTAAYAFWLRFSHA